MTTSQANSVWCVIAGGGTAGHVQPALAIGETLVDLGCPPQSLHFVGSKRGLESRLFPASEFAHTLLGGRGIPRRVSPDAVRAAFGVASAAVGGVRLMNELRPSVVISVGGYAAAPALAGALTRRCPIILVESNAVPGAVNRMAGRFAAASAVAFPDTELPRSIFTGSPVRKSILEVDRSASGRAAARRKLGLPIDRFLVAVVGGSLGAKRINDSTSELAKRWRDRSDIAIRHVVGRRDWSEFTSAAPTGAALIYAPVEYEDDMASLYAAADVIVTRAGASTVSEIAIVGVPAIVVPLPKSPGDHQGANARRLEATGGAVAIEDRNLTAKRLADEIDTVRTDPARLSQMQEGLASIAKPDAAREIAKLAINHARSSW